jgi:hypothetical protein
MYMSDLRHIHDPVLSSLKMEGICFFFLENLHLRITSKLTLYEVNDTGVLFYLTTVASQFMLAS